MAGPIGHGVARALREAREKQALAPGRKRRPPPRWQWWVLVTLMVVCLAIIVWQVVASPA